MGGGPISYYSDPKRVIAYKTLPLIRLYWQLTIKGKNLSLAQSTVDETQLND